MRPAPLAAAVLTALLTVSAGAWPGPLQRPRRTAHVQHDTRNTPRGPHAPEPSTLSASQLRFGRSVGSPTEGKLVGGTHLDETPYLRVLPSHKAGDVRWALEPLVTGIDRAAREVRRRFPDAVTSVGHLSRAGGGEIDRHHSHESGRDADIAFFVRDAHGKQLLGPNFVAFREDGTAPGWPGAHFDEAKNWTFIQALLSDPHVRVTHIFIASHLRARLLAFGAKSGAPMNVRVKAAEVMVQPKNALPHEEHFHVRIGCPGHMQGCVENPAAAHPVARARPGHAPAARRRSDHAPTRHARPAHAAPARPAPHAAAPAAPAAPAPGAPGAPPAPPAGGESRALGNWLTDDDLPPAAHGVPADDDGIVD